MNINQYSRLSFFASILLSSSFVLAESGSIRIISPLDGAVLNASSDNAVNYTFTKGERGDHIHIWVDGKKGPSQKAMSGRYSLPDLTKGEHAIIAKVVDRGHVPTGPVEAIFVKVD